MKVAAEKIVNQINNFLLDSVSNSTKKADFYYLLDKINLKLNYQLSFYEKIKHQKLKLEIFLLQTFFNYFKQTNQNNLKKLYLKKEENNYLNNFGLQTGVFFSQKLITIGLLSSKSQMIDFDFFVKDAYLHELGHLIQYSENNYSAKEDNNERKALIKVLPNLIDEVKSFLLVENKKLSNGFFKRPETDSEKFIEGIFNIGREVYADFFSLIVRANLEPGKTKAFLNYMFNYRLNQEKNNIFVPKTHYVIYGMDLLIKSKNLRSFDFDCCHQELNQIAAIAIYRFILHNKKIFIECCKENNIDSKIIIDKLENIAENKDIDFNNFEEYVFKKINSFSLNDRNLINKKNKLKVLNGK